MLLVMKDLNMQYFPCKICGAKFPSYYFVHKHKKLWHRAQLELEQELEQKNCGNIQRGVNVNAQMQLQFDQHHTNSKKVRDTVCPS